MKSDIAVENLSVSTVHLKIVNATISGTIPSGHDLQRLKSRIKNECPALNLGSPLWNVRVRRAKGVVEDFDEQLFP